MEGGGGTWTDVDVEGGSVSTERLRRDLISHVLADLCSVCLRAKNKKMNVPRQSKDTMMIRGAFFGRNFNREGNA
jgi:hypothetical protein